MSTPEQRKCLKLFYKVQSLAIEEWEAGDCMDSLNLPPFPEKLVGMICSAKTRAGTPCKQKGIYDNGRCKLHGGLSTGSVTPEGKKKSSLNWKKRKIFMVENEPHEMLRNVKVQR